MKTLHMRETACTHIKQTVNQPTEYPTFYLIPETRYVRRTGRAANHPYYHRHPARTRDQPRSDRPLGVVTRRKLRFRRYCADIWSRLKQMGRNAVKWFAWRVLLPLTVACALWMPYVNPAELPG